MSRQRTSDAAKKPPRYKFYGRRHGRKLRPRRAALVEELLPELEIAPPESGKTIDLTAEFPFAKGCVWLEIGFGNGEHLAALAEQNPDIGMIGCEPFINGVATLLTEIRDKNIENIRIWPDDARLLMDALPDAGLERCYLLHPDPWPKTRHHRRRFIQTRTLDRLAELMADGAELRTSTDDPDLAAWMLDKTWRHPAFEWTAKGPEDWRTRPEDWPDDLKHTRYEKKGRKEGRPPFFLVFRRKARA